MFIKHSFVEGARMTRTLPAHCSCTASERDWDLWLTRICAEIDEMRETIAEAGAVEIKRHAFACLHDD